MTKKNKVESRPQPQTIVSNCSVVAASFSMNDHHRDAITALAKAAEANANAIKAIADSLKDLGGKINGPAFAIGTKS